LSKRGTKTSSRRKRSPRGAHIVDRDAADRALAKREREERRQQALEESRREQQRLERRIERERQHPAMGAAPGADYRSLTPPETTPVPDPEPVVSTLVEPVLQQRFPDLPWDGRGTEEHAVGSARAMLRQGYNVRKVVTKFGVGLRWLDDIPIDEMGFGLSEKG